MENKDTGLIDQEEMYGVGGQRICGNNNTNSYAFTT